jgi:hypothetical protein
VREHFVVPSIQRREVTCTERPNVRYFEHFLQLLDVVNGAFNVHYVSISNIGGAIVKWGVRVRSSWRNRTRRRGLSAEACSQQFEPAPIA